MGHLPTHLFRYLPSLTPPLPPSLPPSSGYDIQYFLGTLTPVLTSLHGLAFYFIYGLTLAFLQPCAFTAAQDRYVSSLPPSLPARAHLLLHPWTDSRLPPALCLHHRARQVRLPSLPPSLPLSFSLFYCIHGLTLAFLQSCAFTSAQDSYACPSSLPPSLPPPSHQTHQEDDLTHADPPSLPLSLPPSLQAYRDHDSDACRHTTFPQGGGGPHPLEREGGREGGRKGAIV